NNVGTLELEGLNPGETYYVKVAGFNNTDGEFCIDVEMDESPVCPDPSDITIGEIGPETAEVSWTANGDESEWEVVYGEPGFDPETEEIEAIITNNTSTTLTDLEPETDYEVYVRAICGVNNTSDWANSEIFTTDEMSVDYLTFESFTYYPNPMENQLNLKADSKIEKVEIFNLLGQKVTQVNPDALQTQINAENLQSGVYLMKVYIDNNHKTFRIVK